MDAIEANAETIRLRFTRCLTRYARRFDIDDLLQVTSMKAHIAAKDCRAETPVQLKHWILTIAQRSAISAIRSENTERRNIGRETNLGGDECELYAGFDQIEAIEHQDTVERLLGLTPSQRCEIAVKYRYIDGLDYVEIGKRMAISVSAAKNLVHRGLKAIKDAVSRDRIE